MIATIVKRIAVAGTVVALVSAGPAAALADTMSVRISLAILAARQD